MCAHLVRPEEYERWYRDEPKESTVPDEWVENAGDHMPRARYLLDGLKAQEERSAVSRSRSTSAVTITGSAATSGRRAYRCDGVELNRKAFEIGEQRGIAVQG
jgi:hypothetical protein